MKLYIKQKVFSLKDKFNIYDENGETRYYVEGEIFTLGKKLHVFDRNGNEVAFIRQKVWSFLSRYFIERNGDVVATVVKQFSFKPHYEIAELGWSVSGNFWEHDYSIEGNKGIEAVINKKWFAWGDTYEIDITYDENAVNCLCVVLIIDAVLASQAAAASSGGAN